MTWNSEATWYFSVKKADKPRGKWQWVAIGKEEPIIGDGEPDNEPGNIWTEYGESRNDAITRLWLMMPGWAAGLWKSQ